MAELVEAVHYLQTAHEFGPFPSMHSGRATGSGTELSPRWLSLPKPQHAKLWIIFRQSRNPFDKLRDQGSDRWLPYSVLKLLAGLASEALID